MDFSAVFQGVLATASDPICILLVFLGTLLGLIFGCLPGLTAAMGCALMIPLTYTMTPIHAFGLLLGCFVGGVAGGAISACLLNIPGSPAAICTTLDGYPMTVKGRGAEALGWATVSSGIGTFISWIILVILSTVMAKFCTNFSSSEYAVVALLGLLLVASMSKKDFVKGIIAAMVGLFMSFIGVDAVYGGFRFTYGNLNMLSGITVVPCAIGVFAIPQIINMLLSNKDNPQPKVKVKNFFPSPRKLWKHKWNIVRSSVVGTIVGIVPAIGVSAASFFAYDMAAKRRKPDDIPFGEGNPDGIIAPETANNAVCGGALVPMLTLGIPGDAVTAVLMGALTLQGLSAGPNLFNEHYDVVVGLYTCMLFATIFMVLIQALGIKFFCKMLSVPVNFLGPILAVLSLVGCYAIRNNPFDCLSCLIIGIVAYFMDKGGFNLSCVVLGLVLGSIFEGELRRTLVATSNDWSVFLTRPISCVLVILCLFILVFTFVKQIRYSKGIKGKYDDLDD